MKNLMKVLLLLVSLFSLGCTSTKIKVTDDPMYKSIDVIENGVRRSIIIRDGGISTKNTNTQSVSTGIIVSFMDASKVSIADFEEKYSLELKTRLVIGYYIFQNNSKKSDIDIVNEIINNETNIKTVKPNWKMRKILH